MSHVSKVRLLIDVPVAPEHGMKKGRVLEVLRVTVRDLTQTGVIVMGDTGDRVKLWKREYEEIDE